ncbi:Ytp1 protein [Saccharomycopsis crataegensis]|uniref:Ytp1 protein n=1 Tax=Saccharomycopsis crataegensis TaxID=43959 RepID=A0AAV5QUT2_9ASCO|nr:Ytp1 protein [Saccharomycopsis crataegensis]
MSKNFRILICVSALFSMVAADMNMPMDEPDQDRDLSVYLKNFKWDSFHWLMSLVLVLILPSISTAFAFAERNILATNFFLISTGYSLFEALFLRFNDPNDHENRTSLGTAWFLMMLLATTTFFGLLLSGSKFLPQSFRSKENVIARRGEKFVSRTFRTFAVLSSLTGWVRMCMTVVAMLGFCYANETNHTGQCLAHGIMGSAFIFYGFVMLLWLMIPWFRNQKTRYPPEFWDSIVISVWGCVNTFTEHRPWEPWSHGDYQHTAMGIIWWCMGLVGIYLSKDGHRSFVPGLIIAITGWAMSVHVQHLEISTKVHYFFGLALMFAGFGRVIEIAFVLKDQRSIPGKIMSFQYVAPFGLVEAGLMFMGANEEQLILVKDMGAGHSSYIMLLTSGAALIILWMVLIIELYLKLVGVDKYSGGDSSIMNRDEYSTLEHQPAVQLENEVEETRGAEDFELDSLDDY